MFGDGFMEQINAATKIATPKHFVHVVRIAA